MSRVRFVAIPTAQRPEELRRAIDSYALATDGALPIVIFHSARSAAEQAEVQAVIRATSASSRLSYVGLPEKLAMAKAIKKASGADPALLEFALFQRGREATAAGANRNAALLYGAGAGFLSADDDTLATLFAHPALQPTAAMSAHVQEGDPSDYFSPEGGLTDFQLAAGDPRTPQGGLVGRVEAAWQDSAALGQAAPLVFVGLAGDCGWGAPFGIWGLPLGYLGLPASSLARLGQSRQSWNAALASRRLLRFPSRPTLARSAPGMSTCFGVDAARMLPPFVPLGRGQDLIFTAMVERLLGAPSAWLPYAIAHEPMSERRFDRDQLLRTAGALDLCGVFCAVLATAPEAADLVAFGRFLRDAARAEAPFIELVVSTRRADLGFRIQALLATSAAAEVPPWVREDVTRYCERGLEVLASDAAPWVLDLSAEDAAASLSRAREIVARYGELCETWPNIWDAARVIAERGQASAPRVHESARPARALCSPYQTWLWRAYLLDPLDPAHVTFRAYHGDGPLDAARLTAAVHALAQRHDMLRTRFVGTEDGDAWLDVREASEISVLVRAALTQGERNLARERERTTPVALETAVPLRVTVVPVAESLGHWELWLTFHHIALDGLSEEIFWRELSQIDRNLAEGRAPLHGLPRLHGNFGDLARRQRADLKQRDLSAVGRHWRDLLEGAPTELHVSHRLAPLVRSSSSARVVLSVPAETERAVRGLAAAQSSSIAAILVSAWQAVIARFSGEPDVLLAIDQANRWQEADEEAVGLFMTPLPLRANLSAAASWQELLQGNRRRLADCFTWGKIPFDHLVRAVSTGRRRFELFHALFTHLVRRESRRLQGHELTPLALEGEHAGYEVGLTVEEGKQSLTLVLIGNRALYEAEDLTRLGEAVIEALASMTADPAQPPLDRPWISAADTARLASWNATTTVFPERTLTELLRETARRRADAVALRAGDTQLTYAALWQRSEALALRLRRRGVARDERVGIFVDRSPEMLVALLGVLLAGAGYVPLDPNFPAERLAFMVEDAELRVLLTTRSRVGSLPFSTQTPICLVDEDQGEQSMDLPPFVNEPTPDSLAYILYTSGSTGRPKGVEVPHRALVNFLVSMAREPGLSERDTLLALTTLSFDIAGLELWLPLLVGARIVLGGPNESADGARLAAVLAEHGVTVLQATPSTWRALIASGWAGQPGLKALVGGEALPLDLAGKLAELCGAAWNLYGPTETTVWSTLWRIPREPSHVRIGRPIANTQIHVLDEARRLLPIGVTGQLFIAGAGVARGYRRHPELTAQRFVLDPVGAEQRMYATGDMARWLPDGTLEYLGRDDDQIKLRGYRIEPGEIETALLRLPNVDRAAVVLQRPPVGDARLVAFLVVKHELALPSSADLRVQLRDWLLDHMLPYHFVSLPVLPLTANGKVDRRALANRLVLREPAVPGVASAPGATPEERSVMEHFTVALGSAVDLDTDFFEAGGDSLAALRVTARLAAATSRKLTTGELFLHATPRRMAARLAALSPNVTQASHLVALRVGQNARPVFLIHPVGGRLAPYARLAHHLDSSIPVYGLEVASENEPAYASIAERCAAYVREIVAACEGPVTLGGYSLGGVLAFEIACQLRRLGREVPLVFLLDSSVPRRAQQGWAKWRFRAGELRRFSQADRWRWVTDQLQRRLGALDLEELDLAEGESLIDAAAMHRLRQQALAWQPLQYPGPVQLYRAERHVRGYTAPPGTLGWDATCERLTVKSLPCDHSQMVLEPHLFALVADLNSRLTS